MNAKGLKEVLYEGVNTGEKDYSALVSKLKQAASTSSISAACTPRPASSSARCATRASTRR